MSDKIEVVSSRNDSRLRRLDENQRAVDDKTARAALAAALKAPTPEGRRVSVSRVHAELVESDFRWKIDKIVGLQIHDSDLSSSVMSGGWFGRVRLEDSRLERVQLAPFRARKVDIRDCEFSRTDFGPSMMASFDRCTMANTTFDRCDFRDVRVEGCSLSNVAFERIRGHRLRFRGSELVNVRFTGPLAPLFFLESTLTDVDFSAADPADISFETSTLRGVRMPRTDRCVAVRMRAFGPAVRPVLGTLSPSGQNALTLWLTVHEGSSDTPIIVGKDILSDLTRQDSARVIDALQPFALDSVDYTPDR